MRNLLPSLLRRNDTPQQSKPSASDAKLAMVTAERDFWCEQARLLQNQLQTVMRTQAGIMEQLAASTVAPEDLQNSLNLVVEQMRQPLTVIAATEAAIALSKEGTQGRYTAARSQSDRMEHSR